MSLRPAGKNVPPFGQYGAVHGDLVFFEQKHDVLSSAVANLDWPQPAQFKVSHVGIVDARVKTNVLVFENVHPGAVIQAPLTTACNPTTGPRRMFVVSVPEPRLVVNVLLEADAMRHNSSYDEAQLVLAGVAAFLRRIPHQSRRDDLWETVHRHSRFLFKEVKSRHGPTFFAGTCAGMVAEAQNLGGADLGIREPQLPRLGKVATAVIAYLSAIVDNLLELVNRWPGSDSTERPSRDGPSDGDIFDSHTMGDRPGSTADPGDAPGGGRSTAQPPPSSSDGGSATAADRSSARDYVSFGPTAALDLMADLGAFGTAWSPQLWLNLQTIFNALDRLLSYVPPDGRVAPQPGCLVYRPLMSLGLILQQRPPVNGPFRPFP
jgi:hypothetical protein